MSTNYPHQENERIREIADCMSDAWEYSRTCSDSWNPDRESNAELNQWLEKNMDAGDWH